MAVLSLLPAGTISGNQALKSTRGLCNLSGIESTTPTVGWVGSSTFQSHLSGIERWFLCLNRCENIFQSHLSGIESGGLVVGPAAALISIDLG
ncbi:hypothetical protein DC20_15960 [Rufibacter tibetensis]|uniref:Uncharacterized protein n=1 Tax=Rufibacter tibetensis TaxID=512763 RepID=A0A0P0C4T4_9BACT|nr:hypothetical protein DC20_15960 [Rufibacter tibetensis]